MACIKLRSRWAVEECISTLQEHSMSKFVHYNSSKTYSKDWKPAANGNVYWEWNKPDIQTASIPFDEVPFMFIGHRYMACHQGVDAAKKKKEDYAALKQRILAQGSLLIQNKTRTQGTKKVGCPALVRITRIAKFPQYKLTKKISLGRKRQLSRALKQQLSEDPSSVNWEEIFYVCLPSNKEHVGHPVASMPSSFPVMDERIEMKIIELTKIGVRNVRQMRRLLREYIERNPHHQLCPSHIEIRNVMRRTQEDLEGHELATSSVEEDVVEIPFSMSPDEDSSNNTAFKQQCLNRLRSMLHLVDVMKDGDQLKGLAEALDGLRSSHQSTSSLHDSSLDHPRDVTHLPSSPTFKPIQVIIESNDIEVEDPPYVVEDPPSVVEIAVFDDAMYS